MPVSQAGKLETRVVVLPSAALPPGQETALRTVRLRHPRTGAGAAFLHNPTTGHLCEMLAFTEEHRAWFIGQKLVADGRLVLATPVHPMLLALPYLAKAERLVPLDQMLEDPDFPLTEELLGPLCSTGLERVAESKGQPDLNVWKYSPERALAWLEDRVARVAAVLESQGIDLTGGAASLNFRPAGAAEPGAGDFRRAALGIVTEYLEPGLAGRLGDQLGLAEEKKPVGLGQKRQSVGGQGDGPKPKKIKSEGPAEDYSKKAVKAAPKEEQSAKAKALAISAKGTKSISSFFTKKT